LKGPIGAVSGGGGLTGEASWLFKRRHGFLL
jgi:hypothetical protein